MSANTPAAISSPGRIIASAGLLFLISLAAAGTALGYGYHDALNYGNTIDVVSIRSAALVGIRVFGSDGAKAVFLNPSALGNVGNMEFTCSISSISWTEEVVDSTNITQRSNQGLGSLGGAAAFRINPDIVIAGGVAKVSDHQYNGTHFLPSDPSHPGIAVVEILESSGGLWEALGGISVNPTGSLRVGVSTGLRFGSVDYTYSYDQMFTPELDSTATWTWEESDFCYHAGAQVGDDIMDAGVSYSSGSGHYRARLCFAGRARAEHINNIRLGFEGEIIAPFKENFFNGKLSLEAPIRTDMELLAGVGFYEGEQMNRVGTAFSVGGRYSRGPFRVECALFHSGRSRNSTAFPEEYSDYVDDSWTQFCIGLGYII